MMTGIGTPSSHKRIPRPMTSLLQLMVEAIKSRPGKSFRRGMDEGALNAARERNLAAALPRRFRRSRRRFRDDGGRRERKRTARRFRPRRPSDRRRRNKAGGSA